VYEKCSCETKLLLIPVMQVWWWLHLAGL